MTGTITPPRAEFEAVKDALVHARNIAMEQTMKARIPECGEFGAIAQNLDWVLNVALAQQATKPTATDKALSQFCRGVGRGPDAPYPGMIEAFENHYGQSFTDKDWRNETGIFAAAWRLAMQEQVAQQAEQVQPVKFLANGARFKLTSAVGHGAGYVGFPPELIGRWVALVAADDDCHLKLAAAPKGGV